MSSNFGAEMAWVKIGRHRYYRRSVRVGGRVVNEHVGRGPLAVLEADLDAKARLLRRAADEEERAGRRAVVDTFDAVMAADRLLADLFGVFAHRAGFYLHRRQWRRGRGADVSLKSINRDLAALITKLEARQKARRPLLEPNLSGVPDADRETLAKAAKGDAAALVAAAPYLNDPKWVNKYGSPAYAARAWLVYQAAGDNRVVNDLIYKKVDTLLGELGWGAAGFLERVAITRIVNNWLAVHTLEAKANEWPPHARERAAAERCLSMAERRLFQSVKNLALLRGIAAAGLMARVTVAVPTG